MDGSDLARQLDRSDVLARFRKGFRLPKGEVYLDGNSLGPLCHRAKATLDAAVTSWETRGIGGWLESESPWFDLTDRVSALLAPLVGAEPEEVVVANSTTVNLHQMLATFYAPSGQRRRIVIDATAFPTDRYAIDSHCRMRGIDAGDGVRVVPTRDGRTLDEGDIISAFDDTVQLAILPSVIYTSGQLLDLSSLVKAAHHKGVVIGFDCSHSAGVVPHQLSQSGADFAFFCTYKYLNGGPGAPAAMFIHRRHHGRLPGMAGWFGARKESQFLMQPDFDPAIGAKGLQLGTPHILSLAALDGALQVVSEAGVKRIREKSEQLTACLRLWIQQCCRTERLEFADPLEPARRGGHVALLHPHARALSLALRESGVIVDHRPPYIVRLAPSPLYVSFADCWRAATIVGEIIDNRRHERFVSVNERIP